MAEIVDLDFDFRRAEALGSETARGLALDTGTKVFRRARMRAPSRTGRLRASIRLSVRHTTGGYESDVSVGVNYARYVMDGTPPHMIFPRKRGGVLRFASPAGSDHIVFARYVKHPGTRANPFLARALAEVAPGDGFALS